MSEAVTQAYMRGRMAVILTCFALALVSGFGFILIQAQRADTSVRFGSVFTLTADAAGDVINAVLKLEKTSYEAAMTALSGTALGRGPMSIGRSRASPRASSRPPRPNCGPP